MRANRSAKRKAPPERGFLVIPAAAADQKRYCADTP